MLCISKPPLYLAYTCMPVCLCACIIVLPRHKFTKKSTYFGWLTCGMMDSSIKVGLQPRSHTVRAIWWHMHLFCVQIGSSDLYKQWTSSSWQWLSTMMSSSRQWLPTMMTSSWQWPSMMMSSLSQRSHSWWCHHQSLLRCVRNTYLHNVCNILARVGFPNRQLAGLHPQKPKTRVAIILKSPWGKIRCLGFRIRCLGFRV